MNSAPMVADVESNDYYSGSLAWPDMARNKVVMTFQINRSMPATAIYNKLPFFYFICRIYDQGRV